MTHPVLFNKIMLLFVLWLPALTLPAQVVITTDDMPQPGDTIRTSTNITTAGVDYTLTGENYQWDFGGLFPLTQTVDTFASVSSVPFVYQLVFIPNLVANLAQKYPEIDTIPQIQIIDPFRFFKNTSGSFNDVGLAVTINSIPIPLRFSDPDVVYKFPVSYGNADSSFSGFEFNLPGLGYLSIDRKRVNTVDGWGTLNTPYGTHDVIRLKSQVSESDTVFIDSIGQGMRINRNYTEYKWMANGFGEPLLQVYTEGPLLTVTYIDSVRSPVTGVGDQTALRSGMTVAPNPCREKANISFTLHESGLVGVDLYNLGGQKMAGIFNGRLESGSRTLHFNPSELQLPPAVYIVRLQTGKQVINQKIVVQ